MRQKQQNKFKEFFADKGFYIILILCIAAIGISGYVLFFSGAKDTENDTLYMNETHSGQPLDSAPKETELQTAIPENAVRETPVIMAETDVSDGKDAKPVSGSKIGGKAASSKASNDDGSKPVSGNAGAAISKGGTPAAGFYVWPVNGEIIEKFSVDELVFNKTMDDWRVHPGIDIAANLGSHICAIGDGVVEDVYKDELMGVTVVIDHGNKTKSVYNNLMDNVSVEKGDSILAGDVIGGVGQTAENETMQSPHLHLEVIRNGAQIDPCTILP